MTRTALRRRPTPSRGGLLRRDDRELLAPVTGEPPGSPARSAPCEILVQRYEIKMHVSRLQAAALRHLRGRLLSLDRVDSVPGGARGTSLTQARRQS